MTTMEDSEFEKETDQTPNIKKYKKVKKKEMHNSKKKPKRQKRQNTTFSCKGCVLSFYKYRLAKWTVDP